MVAEHTRTTRDRFEIGSARVTTRVVRHIGILTGGGDAPGLNAVIRAVVLAAHKEFGIAVTGIRDGFGGFAEGDDGLVALDHTSVRGLLWRGGSILGCNNRYQGTTEFFVERIGAIGLEGLIVAGGDGSLTMAKHLSDTGVPVVGVPKTIDNDVMGTDQTFGFDTAVETVSEACSRLIFTAEAHHRVMIAEVMGRHAGHIALHGAMAAGADIALIPEIPFTIDGIVRAITRRSEKGRTYTLIVVAEGAKPAGGQVVVDELRTRQSGRQVHGGIAALLAEELRGHVRHEVRSMSLSHLQRGGMPSTFDRVLGTRMGVAAVRALAQGEHGTFTAYRQSKVLLAPLSDAAGKTRMVNAGGRFVSSARAVGISFGDD